MATIGVFQLLLAFILFGLLLIALALVLAAVDENYVWLCVTVTVCLPY